MVTDPAAATEWSRSARSCLDGAEMLTARFVRHRYARHAHDAYVLAVIDDGGQAFDYRGGSCLAVAGDVVMLEPGEMHDGRPVGREGYLYRTLHLAPALLADDAGRVPSLGAAVVRDGALRSALDGLCRRMTQRDVDVESCREALTTVELKLARYYVGGMPRIEAFPRRAARSLAEKAICLLKEHAADPKFTTDDVARLCSTSRSHLSRAFAHRFGCPPHAWLVQWRLDQVRRRLRNGESAAEAAAAAGFVDQSHLIRRFKAVYGITPGRWMSAVTQG